MALLGHFREWRFTRFGKELYIWAIHVGHCTASSGRPGGGIIYYHLST